MKLEMYKVISQDRVCECSEIFAFVYVRACVCACTVSLCTHTVYAHALVCTQP